MSSKLRFAVICASNQNRSMEAHSLLSRRAFAVSSYGTGSSVRLPGPSAREPQVYDFGTPYARMYDELSSKDPDLYASNGVLAMLDRNRQIKRAPERWHDELKKQFDVVITCESRCFDSVVEDLMGRQKHQGRSVVVVNVEIRDNHEDAATGGRLILQLAQMLEQRANGANANGTFDVDAVVEGVIEEFMNKNPETPLLYAVCFY